MWIKNTAPIAACIFSVGVVVWVYWSGLRGPFVFDDLTNILLAPAIRLSELNATALYQAAFWESTVPGRPIAMLSFALNYYFSGFSALAFKATNVAIHLFNFAALLWLTHKLLAQLYSSSDRTTARNEMIWLALAISLVWAVHPLNLTSILYVVQRMTSLSTLFVLLGLIGYIQGRLALLANRRRGLPLLLLSLAIFTVAATLTKENGILLPAYAFLIEAIVFRFKAPASAATKLKTLWVGLATLAILGLVLLAINGTMAAILSYQHRNFTLVERLLTEARALWFYIKLILLPNITEMGVYHDDFPISRGIFNPPTTPFALLGIVALLVVAAATVRKARVLSLGLFWFFLGHSIESTALPLELIHEHRNYLPQFGILFACVYYAHLAIYTFPRAAKSLVFASYIALLSGATHARATDWKDEWTLYNRDVVNHPHSVRARTMLGIILHDNGQYALAREQFVAAANLDPKDSHSAVRLAQHLYESEGKIPEDTLHELEHRLRHYAFSSITLWTIEPLLKVTAPDRELNLRIIKMYEHLIARTDPELAPAWKQIGFRALGFAYRERRDYRTAIAYFQKAVEIEPLPVYRIVLAELSLQVADKQAARAHIGYISDNAVLTEEETERVNRIKERIKQK